MMAVIGDWIVKLALLFGGLLIVVGTASISYSGFESLSKDKSSPPVSPSPSPQTLQPIEQGNMVYWINYIRKSFGCGNLSVSQDLKKVAQERAEYLSINKKFEHDGYLEVVNKYYPNYMYVGENLAGRDENVDQVMLKWMGSREHRDNIINCSYTEVGIGKYEDIWIQIFGTPSN